MITIVEPSYEICKYDLETIKTALKKIEWCGRKCYKSEDKIMDDSASKFVKDKIKSGHHSMIEHVSITVNAILDRGVSHELVRHRIAAYSQESTRYCNYVKKGGCVFIKPLFFPGIPVGTFDSNIIARCDLNAKEQTWLSSMFNAASDYEALTAYGCSPQEARSVLPNSTKTEIVMTFNLREWRHVLSLRALGTAGKPHPQMVEIMEKIYDKFSDILPEIFDNLDIDVKRKELVRDIAKYDYDKDFVHELVGEFYNFIERAIYLQ
jgi:thymidylate synthase (FAD)